MAVAMCPSSFSQYIPGHLDRYYSMEATPSPPSSLQHHVVPEYYHELEDDAFHSDEELQKVSIIYNYSWSICVFWYCGYSVPKPCKNLALFIPPFSCIILDSKRNGMLPWPEKQW